MIIIYDFENNFLNILLLTIDELMDYLNINPLMNTVKEHIMNHYIKEYREIINVIPVDIRRKMLIESGKNVITLTLYKNLYTFQSSYDDMIEILKKEIMPYIQIFRKLKYMSVEKETLLHELLTNYKNYKLDTNPDIYKWTDGFIQLVK